MTSEIVVYIFLAFLMFFGVVFFGLYLFFKCRFQYWEKRKIIYAKPSFPFGSLKVSPNYSLHDIFKNLYDTGKQEKVFGAWVMHKPILIVNDPVLIQYVLVDKFANFEDHGAYMDKKKHSSLYSLFFMNGTNWKTHRAKVAPIFSSGKFKKMFPDVWEISKKMSKTLEDAARKGENVDGKKIFSRYILDVLMSSVFGIDSDTLNNIDSLTEKMWKRLFQGWKAMLRIAISFLLPEVAKVVSLCSFEKAGLDFFLKTFLNAIHLRDNNNIHNDDALQHLMGLRNEKNVDSAADSNKSQKYKDVKLYVDEHFTSERAATLALGFVLGSDNTPTAMQFALYELALNNKIQEKVQEEIKSVLENHGGESTYEAISQMTYLDHIVQETLRKYSPSPILIRICTKDCYLPNTNLYLKKGTPIYIPVKGIHMDERYYPNPEKFNPDRFSDEEKLLRPRCTYLPFGDGPRACIGKRFAIMEMKAGLACLLSKYKFKISSSHASERMIYDFKSLPLSFKNGLYFKISHLAPEG